MSELIKQTNIIRKVVLLGTGVSLITKRAFIKNLLMWIRMKFITIHLLLVETGVMEVLMLLKIHLVEYVWPIN